MKVLARLGYFVKGMVYITLGVLTAKAAILVTIHPPGTRGVLEMIGEDLFGQVTLAITAAGLFGYALWQGFRATVNPERYPRTLKGVAKRLGLLLSAGAYASLTYFATVLVLFDSPDRQNLNAEDDWTEWLLSLPFGQLLVGLGGLVVVAVALNLCYVAYSGMFMKRLELVGGHETQRRLITTIGRLGIAARGLVIGIVGIFFIQAAWDFSPERAGGLREALRAVENGPYGQWLLSFIAVGLVAFGLYELLRSRYRRIPVDT
ncbi:hypothetical protein GCM10008955_37940 [Deinococcus malanensis]|uniref:DUF1206 domain-containing protein n=1 Tax=Deinococcus malanensis TaxID=1706855 RepID=A0ABQ2F4Q0_9DEIO|nr:DUF1206 domain-containing protein [Deinococcus malanensis]GGK40521.1 hypothetical protein GCM10008955_37940 [Deinococcus malanensis]